MYSGAAVVIAYFLYSYGKNNPDPSLAAVVSDGINPNWEKDPIVVAARSRDIMKTPQIYPVCEVWNDRLQVYLGTGDVESDRSIDACFDKNPNSHPRYTSAQDIFTYPDEDALFTEPPSNAGTCLFSNSDPDPSTSFFTVTNFPGFQQPVNRSTRLCFAAGETPATAGRLFKRNDGHTFVQPGATVSTNVNGAVTYAPLATRCEEFVDGDSSLYHYWQYGPNTSPDVLAANSEASCVSLTTPSRVTRWRDADAFSFMNPFTQTNVQIKTGVY